MVAVVTGAEQQYADALAAAIVASLQRDSPCGELSRLVIRWFDRPDYLTVHALGTEQERDVRAGDAWYPLEWPNKDREIDRVAAVMQDDALRRAVKQLAGEIGEDGWPWDEQPEPLVAAARMVRELVVLAGIPSASYFAVGVSHFDLRRKVLFPEA